MAEDWVLFDDGKGTPTIHQIASVNDCRDCIEIYVEVDGGLETRVVYAKYIQPIPLTDEMLEANGFVAEGEADWLYFECGQEDLGLIFSIRIDEGLEGYRCYRYGEYDCITDVHELQHAMRLCMLVDEADDFVVEIDEPNQEGNV